MGTVGDYGRQALDFIESLEGLATADAAMDAMAKGFGAFGFQTLIVTGLPNPDQRFEQVVMAKRWPAEWFELYTAKRYIDVDPVARLCRNSLNPFEWSQAPYDPEREPRALEVMRRAADFRMSNGFIVPIHGGGYDACISLGGDHLDLNTRSKPAIHLMAMYGFDRVRRLLVSGEWTMAALIEISEQTLDHVKEKAGISGSVLVRRGPQRPLIDQYLVERRRVIAGRS